MVTIVVLLILAGITIQLLINDGGIFSQAQNAKLKTEGAKAREKLEVILASVQIEKQTNQKYNQDDFLDIYILDKLREAEVVDNIVIVDNYAFELDRSVPKIGKYLGKKEELIFPEVEISIPILAEDSKTATYMITAKEEKNGINKIEIIQDGHVIKEYNYESRKDEIVEEYVADRNGKYIVRVYAKVSTKRIVTVNGIIMLVEYSPNGNKEYKKEHQVRVNVNETDDKVTSMKYQWLNTITQPTKESFIQSCNKNEILVGKDFTGAYYLWVLLETQSGKTEIIRSEAFYFDNEEPIVTLTMIPLSENSFSLKATGEDIQTEVAKYEFYMDGTMINRVETNEMQVDYNVNVPNMGDYSCYVVVTDKLGNSKKEEIIAKTYSHMWNEFIAIEENEYYEEEGPVETWVTDLDLGWYKPIFKSTSEFYIVDDRYITNPGQWDVSYHERLVLKGNSPSQRQAMKVSSWNFREMTVWGVVYTIKERKKYSNTEELNKVVTSYKQDQYPNEGYKDGFYYEYKGIGFQ